MSLLTDVFKHFLRKGARKCLENSGASFSEAIYKKMSDEELQNTLRCEMLSVGATDHTQIEMILAEMERRGINEPSPFPLTRHGLSLRKCIPGKNPATANALRPLLPPHTESASSRVAVPSPPHEAADGCAGSRHFCYSDFFTHRAGCRRRCFWSNSQMDNGIVQFWKNGRSPADWSSMENGRRSIWSGTNNLRRFRRRLIITA